MNYDQVTHEPLSPGKRCCRTPGSGLEYDGHTHGVQRLSQRKRIPGRMDVDVELCKGARDEMVIGIHALNVLNHCKLSTNISEIVVDSLVARLRSSTISVQLQLAYR
jgi:hypothetical protein